MRLRSKIVLYVIAMHAALAAAATFVLIERPALMFIVEVAFVASVWISIRLAKAIFVPIDLIETGAELMSERDFTSRFVPVGQSEMDKLIDVYNRMVDRLREERLASEERHQLLQKIVEASPAAVIICDFDGNIESINPAATRLLGSNAHVGLSAELRAMGPGESKLVSLQGARRVKASRAEFRDRGFLKSFYLIEEMTDELRQTEKTAYEKLIRMMSHEVNNSVGAVRSLLESSLRYAPQIGEADRQDFIGALTVASSRIDALNRFMAAFADVVRIPPPHCAPTRVDDLLQRVAALLRPELADRRIVLTLALEDERSYTIDANQLEQVVLNVFRNALDAVARDGAIHAAFVDGVLTIRDSGPGIAESIRAELFTPFFTTKRDGRGLGLTIVQEILANHGLPFALTNADGGGAEFSIALGSARA
jgi:nitrogen fixation/metabolism regulation signal transduction histidine kinase